MQNRDIYRRAEAEMEVQREKDDRERERRLAEASAKDPEIARLSGEGVRLFQEVARKVLEDRADSAQLGQIAREKAREARQELARRLKDAGYPEDYLVNVWACPMCQDTGFVGEDLEKRRCGCFEKRVQRLLHENGSPLDRENFDTFDPNLIPDEPIEGMSLTQRGLADWARNKCLEYAKSYPGNTKPTLVISGQTGLGKTFLLHCIFSYLLDRGADAQMVTAYQAFSAMRACHMGEGEAFQEMVDRPALLLDDLGTEPLMKNITAEYLFLLINERTAARRHTVIATNLEPEKLKERYGERLYSRLFDRQNGQAIWLKGKDLRLNGLR